MRKSVSIVSIVAGCTRLKSRSMVHAKLGRAQRVVEEIGFERLARLAPPCAWCRAPRCRPPPSSRRDWSRKAPYSRPCWRARAERARVEVLRPGAERQDGRRYDREQDDQESFQGFTHHGSPLRAASPREPHKGSKIIPKYRALRAPAGSATARTTRRRRAARPQAGPAGATRPAAGPPPAGRGSAARCRASRNRGT